MKMRKPWLFHPFLLAAYPVLFFYSNNIDRVPLSHIIFTMGFFVLLALITWGVTSLTLKDPMRGGLVISASLIWIFFYRALFEIGNGLTIGGLLIWRHKYVFAAWSIFFIVSVLVLVWKRAKYDMLTRAFNAISLTLIAFCLINISTYKFRASEPLISLSESRVDSKYAMPVPITSGKASLPDIYYIILDAYSHRETLKKYYNFDNFEFYDFLLRKGFYIADQSVSNYDTTWFSLSSSLNMQYIQDMFQIGEKAVEVFPPNTRLADDNMLLSTLRKNGYKYIALGFEDVNANASLYYKGGDEFIKYSFMKHLIQLSFISYASNLADTFADSGHRESVLYHFDKLSEVHQIQGPKFVFAHIISPHPPFAFGPNGQKNSLTQSLRLGFKELYVRQLMFVNQKTKEAIESIIAGSKTPPIIIIQGDHGCRISTSYSHKLDPRNLEMGFRILSAYYLPGDGESILYETITPVNTFRVILNHYFGMNNILLEDESFILIDKKFVNITNKLPKE